MPPNALVIIAANPLNVLPLNHQGDFVGSDAGIWIFQLTGIKTAMYPYDIDFFSQQTRDLLCRDGASYIYAGDKAQSFPSAALQGKKEWYRASLALPNAQIYQPIDCASH